MPRPRKPVPSYRLHAQSGQAIVTIRNPDGSRRDVLLGVYNSPDSLAEYQRVIAQLRVGGPPDRVPAPDADLTVNELLVRALAHVEAHYRDPDGEPTTEVYNHKLGLRVVRELYGHAPAREFGPLALKAVRQRMIDKGWCRKQVNKHVARVKRVFKWAASEELIPAAVFHALGTVAGLQAGRSDAVERPPVAPVDPAVVDATLPFLSRHVRGLVAFCRLTGCRPGEACRLTRAQVDTGTDPWVYRPVRHKGRHRGKPRAVLLGPRARALLADFPTDGPDDPVFSPKLAREERYAANRARRKANAPPSQAYVRKANPRRRPGDRYTTTTFAAAVGKAAAKARVPAWAPNQLRHLFGTEVRRQFGLEAAQVSLGHSRADVTQVYAERDAGLAAEVAKKVG